MILGGGSLSLHSCRTFWSPSDLITHLGLQEATHKATPPATSMIWLGLLFECESMTVTLHPVKLQEILDLVISWTSRCTATLHDVQVLMGKLLYVARICSPARHVLNHMLETLHACPPSGTIPLPTCFHKNLHLFCRFLPTTDSIFIIHEDGRILVPVFVDACSTGFGRCTPIAAYPARFPHSILHKDHPISHLEALNVVVAVKL